MASSDTRFENGCTSGSLWDMTQRVQVVTFIGAGGKTTCLHSIIQELECAGKQVIATTTTKVFPEENMNTWKREDPPQEQEGACFWYATVEEKSGKWIGPTVEAVDTAINASCRTISELKASSRTVPNLHNLHNRYWVIEGDGARGLQLKCWEPHEPQIPLQSNCVVLVVDRGLWGNILKPSQVHRPQVCSDLPGHIWNAESAWGYFLRSPVFAPQYRNFSWVILLNGPGRIVKSEKLEIQHKSEYLKPLRELSHHWPEIKAKTPNLEHCPKHLRLALGDAKEGTIHWCDLW